MTTRKILSWLLLALCFATTTQATTYRLQRVTSVTAGNYYVFEQGGYVMNNSISSGTLASLSSSSNNFKASNLLGTETYVWESMSDGRLKNVTSSSHYLYNNNGTLAFGSSDTANKYKWDFSFQEDGTAIITSILEGNRYIGQKSVTDSGCRLYSTDNKPITPYSFVVYQLVEEDGTKNRAELKFSNLMIQCVKSDTPLKPSLTTAAGFNGTIVYSSSNEKVATVDATSGVVTIVGSGHALITASSAATDTYDAGEATYTLLVTDGDGSTEKPYSINDFLSGYMKLNKNMTVQGYIAGYFSSSTVFFTSAANDETIALSDSRDGATIDNSIPVELPSDKISTYGLCTHPEMLGKRITVTGKVQICQGRYGVSSSTDATSSTTYPVTITSYKYATYRTTETLDFSGTGVSAYTAEAGTDQVMLTRISGGVVPSGVGVILYSETAGTYDIPVTDATPTVSTTGLSISDGSTATKDNGIYVLGKKNDNVGFYRWVGDASLASGRVYLPAPASASSAREYLAFMFDEETTGVNNANVNDNGNEIENYAGAWYDLQGRRVNVQRSTLNAQRSKGLYIVNGKKVFIQ